MKNSVEGFNSRSEKPGESENLKIGQLRLCCLRNRKKKSEEKWTETQ